MNKPLDDDIDLPEDNNYVAPKEQTVQVIAEDLHLGPAPVQDNPWNKDPEWWLKRYGPKPITYLPLLDGIVLTLMLGFVIILLKVVFWLITT